MVDTPVNKRCNLSLYYIFRAEVYNHQQPLQITKGIVKCVLKAIQHRAT